MALSTEQVNRYSEISPFTTAEIRSLHNRYKMYAQRSDSRNNLPGGIHFDEMADIPEFIGNSLVKCVSYVHAVNERLEFGDFLTVVTAFSSRINVDVKRQVLWKALNVNDVGKRGILEKPEIFRLYKMMFGYSMSDDSILRLAEQALAHPMLITPGQITFPEFCSIVTDFELLEKMTVDLQI